MSTQERLLDAAEELFARSGVGSSSLRQITGVAGANLAAVHYHFGSKEGLLQAIIARRGAPLAAERRRLLELAESAAGDQPPTVRAILHAFIEPILRMREEHPYFPKLLSRVVSENLLPVVGDVFHKNFYETLLRFAEALHRALPELAVEEIRWRLLFVIGVFHFLCVAQHAVDMVCGDHAELTVEALTERVVSFCEAGVCAPAGSTPRPAGKAH